MLLVEKNRAAICPHLYICTVPVAGSKKLILYTVGFSVPPELQIIILFSRGELLAKYMYGGERPNVAVFLYSKNPLLLRIS